MSKAKSRAAAKRSRKQSVSFAREPNGRTQRQPKPEEERKVMKVAVNARMRVFGLSEGDAKQQFAGSFVGRAHLDGLLSRDQLDAAHTYAQTIMNYRTAIQAPERIRNGRGGDLDDQEYTNRCKAAVSRFNDMVSSLREVDRMEGTNSLGVLEPAVLRDIDMHHMIGHLRIALNAIHRWETKQKHAA